MSVSRFSDHFPSGVHADRPDPDAVAVGSLFSCATHSLVYQTDGTSWSTWFDPSATGGALIQNLVDAAGDLLVGSGDNALIRLPASGELKVLTIISGMPSWETPASGLDLEGVRDMLASALVAGDGIDIDPDDPGDTITITANGNNNVLREVDGVYPDRQYPDQIALFLGATDPGPDGLDLMVDGDWWLSEGDAALDAHIADTTGAHAASAIGFTPTGTIAATDVQGAIAELAGEAYSTVEQIQDIVGAMIASGTGATVTYNDGAGTVTIDATGTGTTLEDVRDMLAVALVAGTNITITPNDGSDTITFTASAGGSGAFVGVKAYRATTFSLASGASTLLLWDAEEYDTHLFHDNTTNNSRLTVPTGQAGYYHVSLVVATDAIGSTGRVLTNVNKNGAAIRGGAQEFTSNQFPSTNLGVDVYLAVGDYVTASHFQDSAGAKNLYLSQSAFSMFKIGT